MWRVYVDLIKKAQEAGEVNCSMDATILHFDKIYFPSDVKFPIKRTLFFYYGEGPRKAAICLVN